MGFLGSFRRKQEGKGSPSGLSPSISSPTKTFEGSSEKDDDSNTHDGPLPLLTFRTFFMAICVAMGGFIFGYDTGQISGFLEMRVFLERFGERTAVSDTNPYGYYFTNVRSGLIVALLSIGTLIGCLISVIPANKYGRKKCIPVWCTIFIIGVVIQEAVADGEWVGIAMGRLVAGLGVGGLSVVVPMYMAETSPVPVRGSVIACYQLFITIGIFTADCINFGTETRTDTGSYRIPMGVGFIWALLLAIGIMFLPETPRWDWNHGNEARAKITMTKFYGARDSNHIIIKTETEEIETIRQKSQGGMSLLQTFRAPKMTKRILLAMGLQMFQQLTGANYFFYYGTSIFQGVGISNSYVTAMILGGVNVGATFFGVWMAKHFPRRESLYIAALWQSMCFLVFASVGQFVFKDAPLGSDQAKTAGTVMIVFACLFIVAFATTWGPLVWASITEMFPYKYRAIGTAFATSSNWLWNFLLAFFTPFITGDIQYCYGYVFAGCNLAASALVFFFLVESNKRTLEEVDQMYVDGVRAIGSRKYIIPAEELRGSKFAPKATISNGGILHSEGTPPSNAV